MSDWTKTLRMISRFLAAGLVSLVVVIAIGQRVDVTGVTPDEGRLFAAMGITIIGCALMIIPPYRHRRRIAAGAVLSLFGMAAFYGLNFQQSAQWPSGWVLPTFFVPGLIELWCAFAERQPNRSVN